MNDEKLNRVEVDVMEIKTDVKWIKDALEKGHECKKESLLSAVSTKIDTNRKLIVFLLSALLLSYIPFVVKFFK